LVSEEDEDGVEKTNESEGSEDGQEASLKKTLGEEEPDGIPDDDACSQRDAKILQSNDQLHTSKPAGGYSLTIKTSIATVPYSTLNSLSREITLMKSVAIGAYSAICKIELMMTNIAQ
jgi:hypothetical protein